MSVNANIVLPDTFESPLAHSLRRGIWALKKSTESHRQQHGQFLTPADIARFMARQIGPLRNGARILDPAVGSATLLCAIIERAVVDGVCSELYIDSFDIDPVMCSVAREALDFAIDFASHHNIRIHARVVEADFILQYCEATQPDLFLNGMINKIPLNTKYDYIIANPPYFKLNKNDPRARSIANLVSGNTNIYTIFMALAGRLLAEQGQACFIVPRSFCSGAYFGNFRREFLQQIIPESVHVFESRSCAFKDDEVLQENIIFTFRKRSTIDQNSDSSESPPVTISYSQGSFDLEKARRREVSFSTFATRRSGETFIRLPLSDLDEEIVHAVDTWSGSLADYGLKISTGPVVPFRAKTWLADDVAVTRGEAVPLLWMQNVQRQRIEWPTDRRNKPQGLLIEKSSMDLLIPMRNYILLRRFSAKEDARRLVAAPFLMKRFDYERLGLENHVNYIYSNQRMLDEYEVCGLSGLLNSAFFDRYFRIVNGTTQVNAAELRALPLPPLKIIKLIGEALIDIEINNNSVDIDNVVTNILQKYDHRFLDLPVIKEARIKMGKIQEAQEILATLGLPKAQRNEISALTLLVLAQLSEEDPWSEAKRQSLGVHDMLVEIAGRYDRRYAENTRETIRRQVIHQFEQAGIVVRNPDEPTLPTNSPRTHYALSDETIRTIRAYGTDKWQDAVETFITSKGALLELYQKQRDQHKVSLVLEGGEEYHLSPGKHNELQVAIIEEFGPRFAPGARLLYLGDTAQKTLILDKTGFQTLGIPAPSHDKLPDVVLYDTQRDWLFLIEAVTSHGPVSPKRRVELEEALKGCSAGRVYVSAFPDFATFKSYLSEIAWETEVWLAELPSHLIHFNGDRFMGPRP